MFGVGGKTYIWSLFLVFGLIFLQVIIVDGCKDSSECGWRGECSTTTNQSLCACPTGLVMHSDMKNCRNASCSNEDCLECLSSTSECTKCASFMSSSSGQCMTKCKGSAESRGNNFMCTESEEDEREVDIVVAIVAGVGAGTVLCVVIILAVCCYLRKTRKKINLQSHSYRNRNMEIGNVKQFPAFDNSAFENDSQVDYRPGKIDPLHYVNELDQLRPHADMLMTILSQVKAKARAMSSSDPRVSTYKGVIHQLCRVLVLIHKKDPVLSIPSDALSLLQWAQQMLDDHREQQSSSGGTTEYPIARISAVDDINLPPYSNSQQQQQQKPITPVYATPMMNENGFAFPSHQSRSSPNVLPPSHSQNNHTATTNQIMANPYSSVPVPLNLNDSINNGVDSHLQQRRHRSSRNSAYATIRRTPSIPNGEFIDSVGDDNYDNDNFNSFHHDHDITNTGNVNAGEVYYPSAELEPIHVSSFSSPPHASGGLIRKEDFQSFLISNGRTSSDEHSTLDKKKKDYNNVTNTDTSVLPNATTNTSTFTSGLRNSNHSMVMVNGRRHSRTEPPPEIFNTSSESYGDIDFTGGYHTNTHSQSIKPKSKSNPNHHKSPHNNVAITSTNAHHPQNQTSSYVDNYNDQDEVVLRNANTTNTTYNNATTTPTNTTTKNDNSIFSAPTGIGIVDGGSSTSTPPVKRNIITNPKALKKLPIPTPTPSNPSTNSVTKNSNPNSNPNNMSNSNMSNSNNSSSNYNNSVSRTTKTGSYFANGRFYEPNPVPTVIDQEGEVYAPGSSNSGRSNVMSTFLGDMPQSRTPSDSENEGDDSDSDGEPDLFPFDPNECTNPVEV